MHRWVLCSYFRLYAGPSVRVGWETWLRSNDRLGWIEISRRSYDLLLYRLSSSSTAAAAAAKSRMGSDRSRCFHPFFCTRPAGAVAGASSSANVGWTLGEGSVYPSQKYRKNTTRIIRFPFSLKVTRIVRPTVTDVNVPPSSAASSPKKRGIP